MDIPKKIPQYTPHILTIKSRQDILYSENASFLYNIFYGKSAHIPIADEEISIQIKPTTVNHGKNYINFTRGKSSEFITVFTIKEFPIADKRKMAELFTISSQFIISQSLYQVESTQVQPLFSYQNKVTKVLRDNKISQNTGWAEMLQTKKPICMQTNIILHAETKTTLEENVKKIIKKFEAIGLAIIREDINTEQTFYASLPANSHFLNRIVLD